MKRIVYIFLSLSLSFCKNNNSLIKSGKEGQPIPSIDILLLDSSTQLNLKDIPAGSPTVLFLFSPFCPYCKAQTADIIHNIKSLTNIRFYFISPYSLENIKLFNKRYHLEKYPNFIIGQDFKNSLGNYFKANGVPYQAIYNKGKMLKKVVVGKVSTTLIKDIATE